MSYSDNTVGSATPADPKLLLIMSSNVFDAYLVVPDGLKNYELL